MRIAIMSAVLTALLASVSSSTYAHHAFAAEFDANRPVHFQGVLSKIEFVNPHSWFHVDVKKPDGTVETWAIEAGGPNALFRRGITRATMKLGTEIVVDGYQAKNGSHRANGRDITLPDGRKFFLGGSSPGAPPAGAGGASKPK